MSFILIFHEVCSSLLVNQDNRKANRGSNDLVNQAPTKKSSHMNSQKVGLINQAPTKINQIHTNN